MAFPSIQKAQNAFTNPFKKAGPRVENVQQKPSPQNVMKSIPSSGPFRPPTTPLAQANNAFRQPLQKPPVQTAPPPAAQVQAIQNRIQPVEKSPSPVQDPGLASFKAQVERDMKAQEAAANNRLTSTSNAAVTNQQNQAPVTNQPAPEQPVVNQPVQPAENPFLAQIKALQDQITGSLAPTAQETAAQERLNALQAQQDAINASLQRGLVDTEGQPIAMDFITGQQAQQQRQASALSGAVGAQQTPLTQQLAQLQAQRAAQLEAAQMGLQFAESAEERAAREAQANQAKFQEVGGNLLRINPVTGQVETVFQAPADAPEGFTLGEGQMRFDAQGNLIASGGEKAVQPTKPEYLSVKDAQELGVPFGTTVEEARQMGLQPGSEQKRNNLLQLEDKVNQIESVLENDALDAVVGPNVFARGKVPLRGGARQEVLGSITQLLSKETIDTLITLKERGGTLGALSDQERVLLQSAASKLGSWAMRDEQGKITGFNVSEKAFKEELEQMKRLTNRALSNATGLNLDDPEIQEMRKNGYSIPQIQQIAEQAQGSNFNQVGSDTNQAAKKVAAAIRQFESGSNYKARGPVVTSGQYKGERALGAFQIMPGNLPSWSKEALGRVVSEQEFLNNPQIQDAIAEYKMGKIFDQYGTVEDVASVWFSGRPLSRAGNAKDVLGTTVPNYVKNVRAIYNNLG